MRTWLTAVVAASLLVGCSPARGASDPQRLPSDAPSGERAHPVQQEDDDA